jgi:hypothetical protein
MSGPSMQDHQNRWQQLYKMAVATHRPASERRIAEAEQAIALRKRELDHQTGQQAQVEKEAMDDAMYVLEALRGASVLCRICGNPITSATAHGNQDGGAIHEECHILKLKLKAATDDTEDAGKKLVKTLQMLYDLLNEYAPSWYTQEHRDSTSAALARASKDVQKEFI